MYFIGGPPWPGGSHVGRRAHRRRASPRDSTRTTRFSQDPGCDPEGSGGLRMSPSPARDGGPAAMADVEIGIGKSGRRAYGFDEISIVPSRRTRDPEDVDVSWEIDAFRFERADHGVAGRQRRVAGHRRAARASSAPWACCTSRASGPATPTPSRMLEPPSPRRPTTRPPPRLQEAYAAAGAARPGGAADQGAEGGRHHRGRGLHPAAHAGAGAAHPAGRARPPGDPGHGRVGRARRPARASRSTSRTSSATTRSR